ncbi:TfuA-like protein [Streptomyces albogriseolus]|uniref:TfuA-like protein n=1 Tax=Streptomyces albogriseolus TaxID=1887 RepID=UPI00381FAF53
MVIHVFVGPSLPRSEPQLAALDVRVWPPAQHGDLFAPEISSDDTVVLIDGVYHQAPALRHKEILAAMGRGIRMVGAASIGALRAAELAPYGMHGVGRIYAAYARGNIDGDDEVAVGQAPDDARALTWPLVNLRHALELAVAHEVLDAPRATGLLQALRAVYYPQRTWAAVRAVCHNRGERTFADWLDERRKQDRHFADLKRADAIAAVTTALDGTAAAASAAVAPPRWETAYFRRWSNAAVREQVDGLNLSTEDRLVYQQVFDPDFPGRWAAYLEHLSQRPTDGGPGLPLAERLTQACGGRLPADRLFHPWLDLRDEETVGLLLAGETDEDRRAVARYADVLARARRRRPGMSAAAVRDEAARDLLLTVWRCPEEHLETEAAARGLGRAASAVEAAKRFVLGFLEETQRMETTCAGH